MRTCLYSGDPKENRTPVFAVRGRRLDRLTIGPSLGLGNNSTVSAAMQPPNAGSQRMNNEDAAVQGPGTGFDTLNRTTESITDSIKPWAVADQGWSTIESLNESA